MSEWPTRNLGDLTASDDGAVAIGPFGSAMKADTYTASGVPVIRGLNISDTRALHGKWVYVSEDFADTMQRCNVVANDLVFPHRGAIGEAGIVPPDSHYKRFMLSTSLMKVTIDSSKANPLFVYYFFRSPVGRHEILRFGSQVGTPGIGQPLTSLRLFQVPLPEPVVQDAIALTLSVLDDKIECNRRMNVTLEATARAIFKDWFVDFGPTYAKIENNPPYLEPEAWALFPNRVDDQDKPEGWTYATLGDIAAPAGQLVAPDSVDPDTPYIGLEHMPRRRIALDQWEGAGKVTSTKQLFHRGDVLFGKLRPYFHKVGVAPIDGICSTDIVVLRASAPRFTAYVLACIAQDAFVAFTDRTSTGTKMPRTNWTLMSSYPVAIPPTPVCEVFERTVASLIEKIIANVMESRTLTATRDLLLPQLMSGEIRVREADAIVQEVARV